MNSFGLSGKSAFGFVVLLGPAWPCRELDLKRRNALLAAGVAGVMPAITLVQLECFLSQALGTPCLLAWPMFLAAASTDTVSTDVPRLTRTPLMTKKSNYTKHSLRNPGPTSI